MPPSLSRLAAGALLVAAAAAHAQVSVQGDAIVFEGRILPASARAFLDALEAHPEARRVVITSGGGQVLSALDMGEAIHARGLDVDVPLVCRSSCANYIFPAGRRKYLGHPLAVGWHGNMTHVLFQQLTGETHYSDSEMEGARELVRREYAFYPRIGVDGFVAWFGKIAPYEIANYYTLAADDMARFGITDVEVGSGPAPPIDDSTPVMLRPDFRRLERERPAMPLEP